MHETLFIALTYPASNVIANMSSALEELGIS